MFGLGFGEIVIIAVVILIFVGPKELPTAMKGLGKIVKDITKAKDDFSKSVHNDNDLREIHDEYHNIRKAVEGRVNEVKSQVQKAIDDDDDPPEAGGKGSGSNG